MKIGSTELFKITWLFTGCTTLGLYMIPTTIASPPMIPVGMYLYVPLPLTAFSAVTSADIAASDALF